MVNKTSNQSSELQELFAIEEELLAAQDDPNTNNYGCSGNEQVGYKLEEVQKRIKEQTK